MYCIKLCKHPEIAVALLQLYPYSRVYQVQL